MYTRIFIEAGVRLGGTSLIEQIKLEIDFPGKNFLL
jgi:hypothetical protein